MLSNRKLNILLIVSWYKTKENPAAGTFFEEQARSLQKRGHKVTVYCPEFIPFSSKKHENFHSYNDNGILTINHQIKALIPYSRRINYHYLAIKAFRTLNRHGVLDEIDIVHAHTFRFAGIVAMQIKKKLNINYIVTEHFTQLTVKDGIKHKVDLGYAKSIYKKASKTFVVSSFYKEKIVEKLKLNADLLEVHHNMVNPIFLDTEFIDSNNEIRIFSVGFLLKRKNHLLQLEGFKHLLNIFPDAQLHIGGDGPEKEYIENKIEELGISENVKMLGILSREDVLNELSKASLFIHTSFYETFGVVLIESLAMGVPVVAFDSGGPRDIINDSNGKLVKENNASDLCKAMESVLNNREKYMKADLRNYCKENFSEDQIMAKVEKTYYSYAK